MLILVSIIILQLPNILGYCHSNCNKTDSQNYCITCWDEKYENFKDQSFCELWNARMCGMMNEEDSDIENAIKNLIEIEPNYYNFKFQWTDINFLRLEFSHKDLEIICEWKKCNFNEKDIRNLCNRKCKSCIDGFFDEFHCEACNSGSYLYKNTCVWNCPEGTIENSTSNTCDFFPQRELDACSPACGGSCTQDTNGYCSSCAQGYVSDYYNSGLCVQFCEAGLSATNGACPDPSYTFYDYVFNTEINPIYTATSTTLYQALVSSASPTGSLNDNPDGPYPIYTNGFYFPDSGTGYIQLPPNSVSSDSIILGNHFSIALWVFPKSWSNNQYFFSKEGNDYISISLYMSPDSSIHLLYYAYDSSTNIAQQYDDMFTFGTFETWSLFEIHPDLPNNIIGLYYNSNVWFSIGFSSKFFSDINTETFSIGKSFINDGNFYGFIFEFFVGWNNRSYQALNYMFGFSQSTCGGCKYCGGYNAGYSYCIYPSNCEFPSQYWSGWYCGNCINDCVYGCVRYGNCLMNLDELCREWTGFEKKECTKCCDNCKSTTNPCSCKDGYVYFEERYDCVLMSPKCATSDSVSNGECITCSQGNYLNYEYGLCLNSCPFGWEFDGTRCIRTFSYRSLIIHYIFNTQTNEVPDLISGFKAYMGSSDAYYPNYDNNDPIPVYQQGLYFSGNSYISLPPNSADNRDIIIGDVLTMLFWIRPFFTGENSYIFSKEGSGFTRIALYLTPNMELTLEFIGYDGVTLANKTYAPSTDFSGNWDSWNYLGFNSGMEDDNSIYLEITMNGLENSGTNLDYTFMEDFPGEKFSLGRNINKNKFYKGFIYEMKWYNSYFRGTGSLTLCGCDGCAGIKFNECLIKCDYNQFYNWDNNTCQNCDENCKSCIRNGNCYLNFDPMCVVASGFYIENCTSCVDGGIGAGDKCVCDYRHEQSGNLCNACYYHIQDRNVISYFSEDYITVVIEFDQAVLGSMPSTCSGLFSSSTIATFGESPYCYWSSDRMNLYVNLGENAEIVENSKIVFNKGVLMTDLNACGGPITAVNVEVSYIYPKPLIYPEASFFVPYQLYIVCEDLILDATKSKGGYHRPLSFSWNFNSNPLIATLSNNSKYLISDPYIFIEKSDLNETVGNITLTLTNWLGFSTNTSKSINIINSNGLFLYYDSTISFELKTNEYKSIEIFTSTKCEAPISSDLDYEWSISNKIGPYVNIDEKLLWNAQTIPATFYSPPSIFGPAIYTFSLNVRDVSTGSSAVTKFSLTYLPSDLIIDLPANMTLYYTKDLSISSTVIDPDNLPGSNTYLWNCTINSYSCNSIIKNPKSSILNVSKSNLKSGTTYIFTLTATKSSKEASKAIEVQIMTRNQTKVTFSEIPKYVNTKENFVIWAYPITTGNYSSYWSLIQGNQYKLMSNINSLSIGFQENSLDPSENYCIQYTISDSNGMSDYKLWFSTNSLPDYGMLEISPTSGIEFSTVFSLTASNFSTPDLKTLEYQFGYYLNGNEVPLNIKNESSFLYTNLPHASPFLTVFVKVYDKEGSYEIFTQNVIVDEYLPVLGDTNNQGIIEFSKLINDINKINKQIIGNSTSSLADLEWARDTNLNSTKLLLDSLYYFDTENFQIIIELLSGIMMKINENDKITENQRDTILLILDSLLDKAKTNSVYIRESSIKSIANILDFSASLNSSTLYDNPMLVQHINQILTDLLILASKFMPIDYSLIIDTDYIHIETKLEAPESIKTYKSSIEYGEIALPNENNYTLPVNTTALLYILIIFDNNSTESSDDFPRGFEFHATAITPQDIFPLIIDMTPYNLNITIPYYGKETNDTIYCVFYKNDEWSTDGCQFISYEYPKVLCQCTHASLYTAGTSNLLWPASNISHWWDPFYYSCGLCGFYYIIVIFLFFLESKQNNRIPLRSFTENKILPVSIQHSVSLDSMNDIYKFSTSPENKNLVEIPEQVELESASIDYKKNILSTKKFEEAGPEMLTSHPENNEIITFNIQTTNQNIEERKGWIWHFQHHYFISFFLFSVSGISRSGRFSMFITSLMLQVFLCGIFVDFYGSGVSSSENYDFIDASLGDSQITFACAAAVMANILVANISLILSQKMSAIYAEFEKSSIKGMIRSFFGHIICLFIITLNVVSTYLMVDDIDGNSSKVWMKMILISLGVDLIVVQGIKVVASLLIN